MAKFPHDAIMKMPYVCDEEEIYFAQFDDLAVKQKYTEVRNF